MQMFEFLKKGAEMCKFCKQNADFFKNCKHLNSVDKQDSFKIQCKNCVYTDDHFYAVRNNE